MNYLEILQYSNYEYGFNYTNPYDLNTFIFPPEKEPSLNYLNEWNIKLLKNNCKNQAKTLISNCDWSVLQDVNISNKQEFINYRSILRNYILNPVENPVFPQEPQPIWTASN